MTGEHPTLIGRILHWLREGYPQGVPQQDYVALLGILRRSCTPEEIERIALQLREEGLVSSERPEDQIRRRLQHYLHETPQEEDVRRVAARLAAGGWPLEQEPGPVAEAPESVGGQEDSPGAESARDAAP